MDLGRHIWHPPTDFAGADDIITNLAEGEPGIKVIKHTPLSLIRTRSASILWNSLRVLCRDRSTAFSI